MTADSEKSSVVGAMLPACSCFPQNRAEDQHGEQKEDAGNFEPDFAADAAEGLEESAESACDAAGSLSGYTAAASGRRHWRRGDCPVAGCVGCRRIGLLAFAHDGLAGEAARHTQADTQHTADGFRSHFVYHPCNHRGPACSGTPDMMVAAADLRGDLLASNREMPVAGWPRK